MILVIGTLDTKGIEFEYLRDCLKKHQLEVLLVDAGILRQPQILPDMDRQQFYNLAGVDVRELATRGDRGEAITKATQAAQILATQLYREGKLSGVMGLGGSAGTSIATAAMRSLPYGIPKIMVSTLASGQVQPFVGIRDIVMMPSIVDFCGLNRFLRSILQNAAAATKGMVSEYLRQIGERSSEATFENKNNSRKPLLAATMFGVTTPCVEKICSGLENDFEVVVFHATGTGGRTMEQLILEGAIQGVLDITTTELADELVGGILSAGSNRLTAAALKGIPQLISLGALDMVNFGPMNTVPEKFQGRKLYPHNPQVTLMRTTPEENDALGKEIAQKASASRAKTAILIPLRGVSALDAEGKPFWWPEADHALFQSIRDWVAPQVEIIEVDLHINDPQFSSTAIEVFSKMIGK